MSWNSPPSRGRQVLKRILAEQLLIGIERRLPGQEPEREVAPAPDLLVA